MFRLRYTRQYDTRRNICVRISLCLRVRVAVLGMTHDELMELLDLNRSLMTALLEQYERPCCICGALPPTSDVTGK